MKTTAVIFCGIVCVLSVAACETQRPTRLSPDFGTSTKLVVENQILNPDAPTDLKPVEGLDGQSSRKLIEQYQKSFEGKRKETSSVGFVVAPPKKK